ncbi:hypothetical protein BLA60_11625 [Actinophytocola xinjiangensis]|uniref:Uncharacterized protein n=1 Tax=Actinophytocola xinjiangensis TaxID=485602 RepID=A0A7Z0WPJ7_9PSEU|nr:hypothetical protein [Actinophytocola xinjiangensis]OLF11589.1 hypothetical protein BLA60_11625 [Actinophytocola xinjiangensis]
MSNPPRVTSWLEVPDDCRMEGMLDFHDELRFTFGAPTGDGQYLAFERPALERFVVLAQRVLALREPGEQRADRPTLVA